MNKYESKTMIICLLFIFIQLFQITKGSYCGDGKVDIFDEECDSTEHCTNCYCDDGYESINGTCHPECKIEGCIQGCVTPNECASCYEPQYQWDCHRCGDNYYMEGFMNCIPFDTNKILSCYDIVNNQSMKTQRFVQLNSTLSNQSIDIILYKDEFQLSVNYCHMYIDLSKPFVSGTWIKIQVEEDGYYDFSTQFQFSQRMINYVTNQEFQYGFDSYLSLQENCFEETNSNKVNCIATNDDVANGIHSSALVQYLSIGTYYLHIFGYYGSKPENDIHLFIKKINPLITKKKFFYQKNENLFRRDSNQTSFLCDK